MNGRSGKVLILAMISGLGAMFGAKSLLSQKKPVVETQEVVVASEDLKVEELLKAEHVKVVSMPKAQVPLGSFSAVSEVEGRWVQIKTLAGEPILNAKLAPKNAPPGLVSRIPVGKRAFAIEVNEQTGVSGFILPDHRVDVVQSITPHGSNAAPVAETILQDVPVLAAGTVTTRPEDKSIQVRTVTLAVSPEEVDALVAARSRGPLSLSLRGLNDRDVVKRRAPIAPPPAPKTNPEPARQKPIAVVEPPRFLSIHRGGLVERIQINKPEPQLGRGAAAADSGRTRPAPSPRQPSTRLLGPRA